MLIFWINVSNNSLKNNLSKINTIVVIEIMGLRKNNTHSDGLRSFCVYSQKKDEITCTSLTLIKRLENKNFAVSKKHSAPLSLMTMVLYVGMLFSLITNINQFVMVK